VIALELKGKEKIPFRAETDINYLW